MTDRIEYIRQSQRGYTAAEWAAFPSPKNILKVRELGFETDTLKSKLGDGVTAWNSLPYVGGGGSGRTPEEIDVPFGSPVSLVNNTAADIAFLDLDDGEWLVNGNVYFIPAGGTIMTIIRAWISDVSATQPTIPNGGAFAALAQTFPAGNGQVLPTGAKRVTVSGGPTRVYLGTRCAFSGGTMAAAGHMHAMPIG